VPRNNYHRQEYFPLWLSSQGTLTFEGARLPNNSIENNGSFILPAYDYGYADNYPNSNKDGCSLDIAWAVDQQGQPVQLDHVDFIRCYNALNQVCGTIGETSTEISGAEDLHPEATGISPVTSSSDTQPSSYYSLDGRKLSGPQQGVNIVRMKNGTVRKVKM